MKHLHFKRFEEFFNYFNLPKNASIHLPSTAYFEFQPYPRDNTIIRGWIEAFSHVFVSVSFKYRECDLGKTTWSFAKANETIKEIDYYYEED